MESRAELVAARGLEKGMGGFEVGTAAGAGCVWLGTETRAAFGTSGAAAGRFFEGEIGLLDDDD